MRVSTFDLSSGWRNISLASVSGVSLLWFYCHSWTLEHRRLWWSIGRVNIRLRELKRKTKRENLHSRYDISSGNRSPSCAVTLLSVLCLMMSLPLLSQEGQEDGADAVGVGRGGHRGSDHAARSPAGPQPAPSGLLFQVHHLTPESPDGTIGCFYFSFFFFFNHTWLVTFRSKEPIRLQSFGLAFGGNWRTDGRVQTTRSFFCAYKNSQMRTRPVIVAMVTEHIPELTDPSSSALWAAESNKDQM